GTLQNMRLKGTIPYKKIGGLIFYRYEDIVEMMNTKA
ncbi:DNA-binding protein, partial [Myroides sp. C4067]